MTNLKRLKTVDISSVTIMATTIITIISLILSIVGLIALGVISTEYLSVIGSLVPSAICGIFIVSIYTTFVHSLLYNIISKKISVMLNIENNGTISKISTASTATVLSIAITVMLIIECIVGMLLLQLILTSIIQTLMMFGQQLVALSMYNLLIIFSSPLTVAEIIVGVFIISFVFILLGTYIYNLLASKGLGVEVKITNNTTLESIGVRNFTIAIGIISLVLGIITGIVTAIPTGDYFVVVVMTVIFFVSGFVLSILSSLLYNKLGPKVGKIKFELVDD